MLVGHFRGRGGVPSSSQGRHAGVLRARCSSRFWRRAGQPVDQSEDIVQDILLAVHLKTAYLGRQGAVLRRGCLRIARNKLIDSLRRRGRPGFRQTSRISPETIPSEPAAEGRAGREGGRGRGSAPVIAERVSARVLQSIAGRQRIDSRIRRRNSQ